VTATRRWAERLSVAGLLALGILAFAYLVWIDGLRDRRSRVSPAHPTAAARRSNGERAGPRTGTRTSAGRSIRIGWTAWADAEVVAKLLERVLEDHMGYEAELVMADIGIQYQGVASGDLDAMVMAWLPVTHADYWSRFSGTVVNLGPIYTRARLGWAVPEEVPRDKLGSMADLARPEVRERLGARIYGIDPGSGLMRASERALRAYGLDEDYELVSSSGAAMTAALDRAIRRGEWVVVTAWNPHWMFAEWDLRYLDDPENGLGGSERVHLLVRRGFERDHPLEALEMLARVFIPLSELEEALLTATSSSVEVAVDAFLRRRKARIRYWVTGVVPEVGTAVRPSAPAGRRAPSGNELSVE